jgi:predicted 3-demethylubiquinone-9 3-methyltransferase (glyoxalase superfamily)
MCGWLKDKYGLSWQVVPDKLIELMQDKDPKKSGKCNAGYAENEKDRYQCFAKSL